MNQYRSAPSWTAIIDLMSVGDVGEKIGKLKFFGVC